MSFQIDLRKKDFTMINKLAIVGTGGFARETLDLAKRDYNYNEIVFLEQKDFIKKNKLYGHKIKSYNEIDYKKFEIIIAVGDPKVRFKIYNELNKYAIYCNLISKKSTISKNIKIGKGCIIMDFCYITDNCQLGNHIHFNSNSSCGHDSVLGDFFTSASGVRISGNCNIGNRVYFGQNSSIIQGKILTDDIVIGMNSCVHRNINLSGIYAGVPIKKI
ncbi:MAG: hypothetical protein CL869_00065 [Cytophagia bacterium]|nr:hypothetical protein [Cytophagia bacterium]